MTTPSDPIEPNAQADANPESAPQHASEQGGAATPTCKKRCFARPMLFAACAATLVGIVAWTLPSYGYTFDEVLGALLKGESILAYWSHGADDTYLQTAEKHLDYYDDVAHPDFHRGARVRKLWQFYAFPKTVSALTCHLFRGVILPVDAHHLAIVLIALIGLWYIYRTGWEEAGPVAAVTAFAIVAMHPRMFAHLHNNMKDVCVSTLMAATILTFRRATMTQSVRTLLWAAVLTAMATASKLNAVFVPVIGLPWFVCWIALNRQQIKRRWVIAFLFVPFVTIAVWALLDPMFANDPAQLGEYYRFYTEVAGGGIPHWNWIGLKKFLTCTPPSFMAFFVIGLLWILWKRRGYDLLFYGWWFTLPILRICVPGAKDCDGIRHYLECLPPFAIVASFGVAAVSRSLGGWLESANSKRFVTSAVLAVTFAPVLYVLWFYHPHQTVYYNCFVGGFAGARDHRLKDGDYWCSSYREVIDWMLANNLEPGVIDATYASHILQYYTVVVGGEHKLVHTPAGDAALAKGGRLYLIRYHDMSVKRHKSLVKRMTDSPIYHIERDGRTFVSLYAVDLPKLARDFTIDPRGAGDQRLRVGHQAGRAKSDGWYVKASDKRAFMIYGPYIQDLEPGRYVAQFELVLKKSENAEDVMCVLDVYDADSKTKFARREVRPGDFTTTDAPQTFELQFEVPIGTNLEFRIYNEGHASYGCREIRVRPQGD